MGHVKRSHVLRAFLAAELANTSTGLITLPAWLSITCATTGRTTQPTSATLVKGLGANAARCRNVGSGLGLSVESARTQLAKTSQLDSTWGLFTGCTYALTPGPDGANTAALLTDTGSSVAEAFKGSIFTVSAGSIYTLSVWSGPSSRSSGVDYTDYFVNNNPILQTPIGNASAWARLALTFTAVAGSGFDVLPCAQAAGNTGSVAVGEHQLELGSYPSSLMPNSSGASLARAADVLTCDTPSNIAPGGYFNLDFTIAPNYSQAEFAADHDLIYFDANNRIYIKQSDQTVRLRLGGSDTASGALTWAREDALRIQAWHRRGGKRLTVSKNGVIVYESGLLSAASAISLPASVGILGNATTTPESADLRYLWVRRP